MNKRRLLKLAKLLRANAKNKTGVKFDIESWGKVPPGEVKLDCGTTACAVGLAVISGVFKKQGLSYQNQYGIPVPTYQGERGFFAVETFFNITEPQALYLFHKDEYALSLRQGAKAERAVATRIERFCSRKAAA